MDLEAGGTGGAVAVALAARVGACGPFGAGLSSDPVAVSDATGLTGASVDGSRAAAFLICAGVVAVVFSAAASTTAGVETVFVATVVVVFAAAVDLWGVWAGTVRGSVASHRAASMSSACCAAVFLGIFAVGAG